jgi:hypothetical protein
LDCEAVTIAFKIAAVAVIAAVVFFYLWDVEHRFRVKRGRAKADMEKLNH